MAEGKIDPRDWEAVHERAGQPGVFTQLAWPELNRGRRWCGPRHNDAICDHLEGHDAGADPEARKVRAARTLRANAHPPGGLGAAQPVQPVGVRRLRRRVAVEGKTSVKRGIS